MEYEILEELGHGMFGTVHKIKYKNNYFAMKIEHILDEDKIKDLKSPIWREIDFIEKFAKKHKDQFMQMYHYDFIDSCDHEQKYSVDLKNFEKYHRDKLLKLSKSNTCIRKIYELVDGNVKDIISKLSPQQIYSFIIQISIIVKILEKGGYIHGDFHSGNIGYIKTDKEYIKFGKLKIPTFGYIYKAIDLGSILHKRYKLSSHDKIWFKDLFKKELISCLGTSLINTDDYWDYIENNKIKLSFKKHMQKFKKSDLYKLINLQFSDISDNQNKLRIAELTYPTQYQQLIFGNKYKKTLKPKLYIDILDIIYLFAVNFNSTKIIDYFIQKINL
jgi:hypothetical protein